MVVTERSSWIETANADNALATATRAAPPAQAGGVSHYITSVSGSFSVSQTVGKTLILKQGTTEKGRWYVITDVVLSFPSPIKLDPGTAANLELAASGTAAQVGAVTMTGYTI